MTWTRCDRDQQLPKDSSEALEQRGVPVEALSHDWKAVITGTNPAVDEIPLVLEPIKKHTAAATIIVPALSSQPYWQLALAAALTDCWAPGRSGVRQRPGSHAKGGDHL